MSLLEQVLWKRVAELDIPKPDIITLVQLPGRGAVGIIVPANNDLRHIGLVTWFLPGPQLARPLVQSPEELAFAVQVIEPVVENIVAVIIIELHRQRESFV